MKKFFVFTILLLLLHISIYNPMGDRLIGFEFLAQGSAFDAYMQESTLVPYNIFFNTGMFVLFISRIYTKISEIFNLSPYIMTRGGEVIFKRTLIKNSVYEIFQIIIVKSLIYALFFMIEQRGTWFALYDVVSTFLTLSIFTFLLILCRLNGVDNKILLFVLISGNMINQILSFEINMMSIFVIASIYWKESPFVVLFIKIILIWLLLCLVFFKKNVNKMLEVKIND